MKNEQDIQREILEKIEAYQTIIIHNHEKADPDAVGSQGGLQQLLINTYPEKSIRVIGERLGTLSFLNKVEKEMIPKKEYEGALVIVCDTATWGRIALSENIEAADFVIKIDHHPNNDPYGDLQWVVPERSSTSEMIYELYLKSKICKTPLRMNAPAARLLYAGIVGDTGRFLFTNVHPSTFRAASELIGYEFDPQEIYSKLYEKSQALARMEGKILSDYERTEAGVAYYLATKEEMEKIGVSSNGVSRLVNAMKEIRGHKIWVLFIEEEGKYRVNIRSAKVDIEPIARLFNGGGHEQSSGATVYSWEEGQKLIATLNSIL